MLPYLGRLRAGNARALTTRSFRRCDPVGFSVPSVDPEVHVQREEDCVICLEPLLPTDPNDVEEVEAEAEAEGGVSWCSVDTVHRTRRAGSCVCV